jgi:transcriptional regulator with XRE-family HTH domain
VGDLFEQRQDAGRRRVVADMSRKEVEVFAAQLRAARALLNWSQDDLAMRSGVSRTVIARLEAGQTDARTSTRADVLRTMLRQLRAERVFTVGSGGGFAPSDVRSH